MFTLNAGLTTGLWIMENEALIEVDRQTNSSRFGANNSLLESSSNGDLNIFPWATK